MTNSRSFTVPLTEQDLSFDSPELALVRVRREITERLLWLETHLVPDVEQAPSREPGEMLVARGFLERETKNAINELLAKTELESFGKRVTPTAAARVLESGLQLARFLDSLINATAEKVAQSSTLDRMIYSYFELPAFERIAVALEMGVDSTQTRAHASQRNELAKLTFALARDIGGRRRLLEILTKRDKALEGLTFD